MSDPEVDSLTFMKEKDTTTTLPLNKDVSSLPDKREEGTTTTLTPNGNMDSSSDKRETIPTQPLSTNADSLMSKRQEDITTTPPLSTERLANKRQLTATLPRIEDSLPTQPENKDLWRPHSDSPYPYASYSVSSSMEDLSRPLIPPIETPINSYQRCLRVCLVIMAGLSLVLALTDFVLWLNAIAISTTTTATPPNNESHRKQILLWQWTNPGNLEYYNCDIIDGNALSPDELRNHSHFDAVIFNATADYKAYALPIPRLPQQYYIYALDGALTPAYKNRHNVNELARYFNLTLNHKLDSDIVWTKAKIHGWHNEVLAPRWNANWPQPVEDDRVVERNVLRERYKSEQLLGLTVLNAPCNHTSKKFLEDISRMMPVDIYGDCGQPCPKDCYRLPTFNKGTPYKFYFAFEQELCTDYVSSYFYKALSDDIIPVVFGAADYKNFAPPHSYIQAEDFKTTHALLDYLQYLHENLEEYIKYFAWNKQYMVLFYPTPFEDVCTFLHKLEHKFEHGIQLTDFKLWWESGKCDEARDFHILNGTKH